MGELVHTSAIQDPEVEQDSPPVRAPEIEQLKARGFERVNRRQAMTDDDLAALERLADAATPGPWRYDDGITDVVDGVPERGKAPSVETMLDGRHALIFEPAGMLGEQQDDANGRFAAASRTAIPALVAEVRRLRAHVADVEKASGCRGCGNPACVVSNIISLRLDRDESDSRNEALESERDKLRERVRDAERVVNEVHTYDEYSPDSDGGRPEYAMIDAKDAYRAKYPEPL